MNKYTIGGVILGIFLLATAGIRSAIDWLSSATPDANTPDRIVAADDNRLESDRPQSAADQLNAQSDGIFSDQTISQADSDIDDDLEESLANSPLEKAGTYVQRQKRVEEDSVIAATDVNVIPTADASAVAAQNNNTVTQQPNAPEPVTRSQSTTPAATGTATPSAPVAVPALW